MRRSSSPRRVAPWPAAALALALASLLATGCRRASPPLSGAGVDSLADALQAADEAAARTELARARRAGAGRAGLEPDLAAACDSARTLARRALHMATRRETGIFDDLDTTPRPGCRLSGTGSFAYVDTASTPPDTLLSLLLARGWRQDLRFEVDDDDGVTLAARSGTILCIISGAWNADDEPDDDTGGDDASPPPAPAKAEPAGGDDYGLVIECGRDASRPRFDGSVSG